MLLLADFGVKRHQIDINVGRRNPLYANVEMARYLNGGCNLCRLYTSDAADELDGVDLGVRRILYKKLILRITTI